VPYLNSGVLAQPPLQIWAARAIVFLGVILLGSALAAIIGHFVHTSIFSILDRILGFAFGALRGALILGVLVMAAQFLRLDQQPWWKKSQLLPYGESFATVVRAWVGEARLPSVAPIAPTST
jgi:membrane protein required for colicin V production